MKRSIFLLVAFLVSFSFQSNSFIESSDPFSHKKMMMQTFSKIELDCKPHLASWEGPSDVPSHIKKSESFSLNGEGNADNPPSLCEKAKMGAKRVGTFIWQHPIEVLSIGVVAGVVAHEIVTDYAWKRSIIDYMAPFVKSIKRKMTSVIVRKMFEECKEDVKEMMDKILTNKLSYGIFDNLSMLSSAALQTMNRAIKIPLVKNTAEIIGKVQPNEDLFLFN